MIQKWKILILLGALVWVIFFAVISVLMFTLESIPWLQWVIEWIVSAGLGYLVVGKILKRYGGQLKQGLIYGVILIVVTLILDVGITVPTFMDGKFGEFFGNWVMWVGILLFLAASALVGFMNKGGTTPGLSQPSTQPPIQPTSPDLSQSQ